MGKHSEDSRRGPSTLLGVLVAGAVLVGGTVTAVAMISRGDDPGAAGTTTSSTTTTSGTTGPTSTSEPTSSGPATTATTAAGAGGSGDDAARTALVACRAEAAAGARVAAAAAASARDWGTHAGAQWRLDAGQITYAQAEALWVASKKPGAADVAAFAAADKAYGAVLGACGRVGGATAGSAVAAEGAACAARGAALGQVATTGRVVNGQWAGHLAQMKTKATSAGHAYHMEWLRRTTDAKAALAAYDKAAAALAKAPACTA